jgi:cell division protein FtsI (penicillin-binding protein 3)
MSQTGANSNRLRWLARGVLLWAGVLTARLVSLQVIHRDEYQALADENQLRSIQAEAPRGEILDRNGRVLAMNVPAKTALLKTEGLTNAKPLIRRIAKALEMDAAFLERRIAAQQAQGAETVELKRGLLTEQAAAVEALHIEQVAFRPGTRRIYPNGKLAANVIGWVNEAGQGVAGLELAFNKTLAGVPGRMRLVVDARQRRVNNEILDEPRPGHTLQTTLDARIQHVADEALKKAVLENHCGTGSVVVMDPNTGEVLAMSSYPTFDPNEPVRQASMSSRVNQAISNVFEPGSVFKVITFAAAFENTRLRATDMIACGRGVAHVFGRVIHDHDSYDALSAEDVLAKSSNVGTINIALQVGLEKLVSKVREFGFGQRTGVGLPGESPGLVPQYSNGSLGYVAIGHEIAVTNVQLARAASAVANGGYLLQPRLTPAGAKVAKEAVMKPETSIKLRNMMERVVLAGTGTRAKLVGYTSGGKTGSAQIFDFGAKHYSHNYNASFMGFAPVANPDVVVVVTLNGADKFGGVLAAPVFSEIAAAAMRVRQVRRDIPDAPLLAQANDAGLNDAAAAPDSTSFEARQMRIDPAASIAEDALNDIGPLVPDFRGKSMTSVVSQSVAMGLRIDVRGNGLVRRQIPAPGSVLTAGETIRLTFAP